MSDKYIHSNVEDKIYSYWEKNKLVAVKIKNLFNLFLIKIKRGLNGR